MIKIFFSILLLAVAFTATCQIQKRNTAAKALRTVNKPLYYIDSVKVASLEFFDHNKIEKMNVVKDNDPAAPNGKVFITIKKSTPLQWLSIKDVINENKLPDTAAYIFMLNDNIITDTSVFRIDKDYVAAVEVLKLADI